MSFDNKVVFKDIIKIVRSFLRFLGHQQYLRFGLRDRLIRFFHNPDLSKNECFEIDFFGKKYKGNFNDFIDWSTYYYGAYSLPELLCIEDFLKNFFEPIVVDVGANVGIHSIFASSLSKEVHSFEPYSLVSSKLEEKNNLNNISNVFLHKYGLGDTNQSLDFISPQNNNHGTGKFCLDKNLLKDVSSIKLPIVIGDEYFSQTQISRIDFLKMDIEGFEVNALKGMRKALCEFRPICFVEWNSSGKSQEYKNGVSLFPEDYNFYRFVGYSPKYLLFSELGYSLERAGNVWIDSNYMMLPREKVEKVKLNNCRSKL